MAASGMLKERHLLTHEDDYLRDIAVQQQRCGDRNGFRAWKLLVVVLHTTRAKGDVVAEGVERPRG